MEQIDLLKKVVEVLEALGISYMVVGSYASGAWGEPRFTRDIDIVVSISRSDIPRLMEAFPLPDYYLSDQAIREAITHHGQFNLIHSSSGNKVDFMIEGQNAWSKSQLSRRRRVQVSLDLETYVGSPEDIIISKMMYYREGGSEKHLRDITGILKLSLGQVDRAYVERWAGELGLMEIWQAILRRMDL